MVDHFQPEAQLLAASLFRVGSAHLVAAIGHRGQPHVRQIHDLFEPLQEHEGRQRHPQLVALLGVGQFGHPNHRTGCPLDARELSHGLVQVLQRVPGRLDRLGQRTLRQRECPDLFLGRRLCVFEIIGWRGRRVPKRGQTRRLQRAFDLVGVPPVPFDVVAQVVAIKFGQ